VVVVLLGGFDLVEKKAEKKRNGTEVVQGTEEVRKRLRRGRKKGKEEVQKRYGRGTEEV
jgi:hypothetical protein